ncbi:4-(cytidine 5'-diphospho)-2-C-methyl-D-erythritol kinase [Sphingomonas sp.]|uniref:4-(cytidine 5'-diphospho)-2-C-methyl-D-erythritol kinase n=1 Tax=Sphingomonas sp. TaxID=28214 RepID=UPI00178F695B|nr:4-(cytidine 5'-diphospho)-2-C-methyl-D-erythritol kinase [Sphingomonas sp.]MBA3510693.1 4-(cytidine 5'-diphospho)-2-C-methyl-D-erythritol kinase [Sphingomonas sp.]
MNEGGEPRWREIAPAKINLALHVRGKLPDGRHAIETLFAFCIDGDRLTAEEAGELELTIDGPFAAPLFDSEDENLVIRAALELSSQARVECKAKLGLEKRLPVAAGLGGGSADAAAALRLLTAMWGVDPAHAAAVAPRLGADVPACLLSMTCRGDGAGDQLRLVDDPSIAGAPLLLVHPGVGLSTRDVFQRWDGVDRGPLGDWRDGRNDLEAPAITLVPQIAEVLDWLRGQPGAQFGRMSGSGAACFALFASDAERDRAAAAVPEQWWRLATSLR